MRNSACSIYTIVAGQKGQSNVVVTKCNMAVRRIP